MPEDSLSATSTTLRMYEDARTILYGTSGLSTGDLKTRGRNHGAATSGFFERFSRTLSTGSNESLEGSSRHPDSSTLCNIVTEAINVITDDDIVADFSTGSNASHICQLSTFQSHDATTLICDRRLPVDGISRLTNYNRATSGFASGPLPSQDILANCDRIASGLANWTDVSRETFLHPINGRHASVGDDPSYRKEAVHNRRTSPKVTPSIFEQKNKDGGIVGSEIQTFNSTSGDATLIPEIVDRRTRRSSSRKQRLPRRSPEAEDPKFLGVKFRMRTEVDKGQSHLVFYYKYSINRKVRRKLKFGRFSDESDDHSKQTIRDCNKYSSNGSDTDPDTDPDQQLDDGEVIVGKYMKGDDDFGPKECASCGTRTTPLWRDADEVPLCNACGIRYRKYHLRCLRCWYVPKKTAKTPNRCRFCGYHVRSTYVRRLS